MAIMILNEETLTGTSDVGVSSLFGPFILCTSSCQIDIIKIITLEELLSETDLGGKIFL